MMKFSMDIALVLVGVLVLAVLVGCSRAKKTQQDDNGMVQRIIPEDFQLVFGVSGLPGGQMRGHSISADGTVLRWAGKYAEANADTVAQFTSKEMQALWEEINGAEFFDRNQEGMADNNQFLSVVANGESRRLAWKAGPEETMKQDDPIRKLYNACYEMVEAKK